MSKLVKNILIKGKVELLSGMLIGGSNTELGIGDINKMVIKNPINNQPYIPGSSLKGKLRSLYETAYGQIDENSTDKSELQYTSSNNPDHPTAKLFGRIKKENLYQAKASQQASRIIIRDCQISESIKEDFKRRGLSFTEYKTENSINRITSAANPRVFERVCRGVEFDLEFVLSVYYGDDEEKLLNTLKVCMRLLENDYLGMGGSRGNGQIKFKNLSYVERTLEFYEGKVDNCEKSEFLIWPS